MSVTKRRVRARVSDDRRGQVLTGNSWAEQPQSCTAPTARAITPEPSSFGCTPPTADIGDEPPRGRQAPDLPFKVVRRPHYGPVSEAGSRSLDP